MRQIGIQEFQISYFNSDPIQEKMGKIRNKKIKSEKIDSEIEKYWIEIKENQNFLSDFFPYY